jgi:serine/threonine-protein kinase
MKTCTQCHATYPDETAKCASDGAPLVELDVWPDGTVVGGKYRILSRLGQDVVCAVYKAFHLKSHQFRTLKVMSQHLAGNEGFVKIFEQDAQQRKKLRHPNVARVEEVDEDEIGRPFIVMEYVEGLSLREVIQRYSPLPPPRVCAIARQVASGLEAVHAMGTVHRDVKPDSIFLVQGPGSEKVKLLGLGTPKLKEALLGDRFRTSPEAVIGTLQYLSPEQALGQLGAELDGRSDLYSLGVIMYQMLTDKLPFQAITAADWMMAHIQGIPTPIRVAHADLAIPDVLTNLVMACLQKNREARPASARDLVREIQHVEKEIDRMERARLAAPGPRGRHKSHGWKFWKG